MAADGVALYGAGDRARLADEGGEPDWRDPFARDGARVVHSASFRRLQGKTQVFPGWRSDFFRTRLTHSLEVAQIAEGMAERINASGGVGGSPVDGRVCAAAAMIHDIGHPPFGHDGERALDALMLRHGGFEGNAQSLRLVSRLEDKVAVGGVPFGLNLTARTLAAVLKYDAPVPVAREAGSPVRKGWYESERSLVAWVKRSVADGAGADRAPFRTLECSIVDLADDVAYSTFDLEDALKAGVLTPASVRAPGDRVLEEVAARSSAALGRPVDRRDVAEALARVVPDDGVRADTAWRTGLSSRLVGEAVASVRAVVPAGAHPAFADASASREVGLSVEVLKHLVFVTTIWTPEMAPNRAAAGRVVGSLLATLAGPGGAELMPPGVRRAHERAEGEDARMRVACDYVAGMTDRYATTLAGRLGSPSPPL